MNVFECKLAEYNRHALLRERFKAYYRRKNKLIIDKHYCINFCSNDYLGLATSLEIKKTFKAAIDRYGFGSSSSAQVCGYFAITNEVENRFAKFLNRDRAILFSSGYLANLGVLSVLANRGTIVVSDRFVHASIIDGIVLSRAKHYRFPHQNIQYLESILQNKKKHLVITESVFCMEGDISPLDKISSLCKVNNSLFIVDDAHAIGVLGDKGQGGCNLFNLSQREVPCLITPLGKAFASLGAIVSGTKEIIEMLLQFARTYRYTTAMPPAMCQTLLKALEIVERDKWRREKLTSLIKYFNNSVRERKLSLISDDITPIRSVLIGNNIKALKIQRHLLEKGFLVSSIRPPSVPKNTTRIRISLNCFHTKTQIDQLLDWFANYAC